jgi:hypothetical protein
MSRSGAAGRRCAAVVFTAGLLFEGLVAAAPTLEQSARLKVGEALQIGGARTSLTFIRVERDSRCPRDARCIRAGEAVVVVSLREDDGAVATLTFEVPPGGGASQPLQGYRIEVVGLDPQAETDVEIAQDDYVVTIALRNP